MSSALSALLGWGRGGETSSSEANLVVTQLLIHPIKSCRGISIEQSNYSKHGLEHDRTFIVIDAKTRQRVTARDIAKMVLVTPTIVGHQLVVSFPDGSDCPTFSVPLRPSQEITAKWTLIPDLDFKGIILDGYITQFSPESPYQDSSPSEIFSKYLSRSVLLVFEGPTRRIVTATESHPNLHESSSSVYHDNYPLLIVTTESFDEVQGNIVKAANGEATWSGIGGLSQEKWKTTKIEMERFRPNIVLSGSTEPFDEDRWSEVQFGTHESPVSVVARTLRCQVPNIDIDTAEMDKAVPYKVLAKYRRVDPIKPVPCFGVNASPTAAGVIKVGDPVKVLSRFTRTTLS